MNKNRDRRYSSLIVVTALFVTLYLVSNVMAVKVIGIFGLVYFDAGTITFPFAYMLGDVLTEIWGYRIKKMIWLPFCNNLVHSKVSRISFKRGAYNQVLYVP